MSNLRIGPLELIVLVVLAIGMGVAMNSGQLTLVVATVTGCALVLTSFLSTQLSLYILIFSMLLSPELVVGGMGGGTTAGRGVTLRFDDFLLFIIGFAWLVKAAIHKAEAPLKWTPLNKPIMLYVAVFSFATLAGVLTGRVKPLTGFFFCLKYFEYFFLYFMVVNSNITRERTKALITACLVTCFLVSLFAISYIPTGERASAPFEGKEGEPNTLGGYLVFLLAIVAGLLLTPNAVSRKWPYLFLMGIGTLALMATLSRASFLAAAVIVLVLVGMLSYRRPILFTLMTIVLVASPFWAPEAVKKRVLYTFTQPVEAGQVQVGRVRVDTSTSDRLRSWRQAIEAWGKSPVWGFGVTGGPFMDAQYPRVLSETGLLGVVAFLTLLWAIFRMGLSEYQEAPDPYMRGLSFGFLLGFLGMLVHAVGSNTFIIVRIMEPFWLFAGLLARALLIQKTGEEPEVEEVASLAIAGKEAYKRIRPA